MLMAYTSSDVTHLTVAADSNPTETAKLQATVAEKQGLNASYSWTCNSCLKLIPPDKG